MKMTKELKEILLEKFEEMLDGLCSSESCAQKFEDDGDEEGKNLWRESRRKLQKRILKGIGDLIEVEGE